MVLSAAEHLTGEENTSNLGHLVGEEHLKLILPVVLVGSGLLEGECWERAIARSSVVVLDYETAENREVWRGRKRESRT